MLFEQIFKPPCWEGILVFYGSNILKMGTYVLINGESFPFLTFTCLLCAKSFGHIVMISCRGHANFACKKVRINLM